MRAHHDTIMMRMIAWCAWHVTQVARGKHKSGWRRSLSSGESKQEWESNAMRQRFSGSHTAQEARARPAPPTASAAPASCYQ